ncbi:LysR family transcriptional regulator [Amycolatopsis sp. 195334CR]|uniref:LysR family transcriptional regulator n=1 Tax=Amycolatopsis sp. 195334CR TaxID=2814588 RepID=UPI001A902AFB|nr:LysR family transcriptional regulator [Amycolatopsis sp. 195334CR]MBN6037222.1 LysR family transcriptional regulator [Amycolatopsis sp. 195334CR]
MLNLERLRVLRAVSTTGSVSGAAAQLHVTTSAVSQQLARLEREVGQRLVERNGRGIRLTDAAALLAAHGDRLLAQVEQVEADLARHRGAVAGRLSVAAFATAARGLLPGALRGLRAEHPALDLRLDEQEPPEAIAGLCRGDVDVAVVQDWAEAPLELPEGLSRENLLDDPLDLAVPVEHALAARTSVTLADLVAEEWITWTSGQLCHDWLTRSLGEPRVVHTASEHSTQLALVAAGLGVAVLPLLGRDHLPAGVRLVEIRPRPARQVHVLWRTSAARRPAIRAVVTALRSAADELTAETR